MFIRPTGDRLLVQQDDNLKKTKGGLFLPGSGESQTRGKVMAVGPGKLLLSGVRAEMEVEVDDIVYFEAYSGTTLKFKGADGVELELLCLKMDNVLSYVKKEDIENLEEVAAGEQ
jgi:chaperonin GroES